MRVFLPHLRQPSPECAPKISSSLFIPLGLPTHPQVELTFAT
jgi:hypothetical protein